MLPIMLVHEKRKGTAKLCIKAAAYVQLFNFLVRLLFICKCGFYSRAACMLCSQSAKPVKAVWYDVTCRVKAKLDFVMVIDCFKM